MSDPFRLRVLKALTAALKQITPDDGYVSDLSDVAGDDGAPDVSRVYRGRAWFGEDDPLPLVSVLEAVESPDEVGTPPVAATGNQFQWKLLVQGFVEDDAANPTDPAYALLADVRQRLAAERTRKAADGRSYDPLGFGSGSNRIEEIQIGPGVCRPADDVSSRAWFWVPVTLRTVEDASDPYA